MGSKGGGGQMQPMLMNVGTQNQQTTNRPDPYAYEQYKDIISRAQAASKTPYQQFGGERIAGFSPDQLAAFQGVRGLQGVSTDLYGQATGAAQNVLGALDPSKFSQNVQQYMSPYMQNVVGAAMGNLGQQQARERSNLASQAIKSGAMGGDRYGMERAELARTQGLASGQTLSNLLQYGYQNAADQYNKALGYGLTGATTLGGLASQGQQTALQGLQALLGTGGQQQSLEQAQRDVAYQNFLQQQAYPYQQLSWLSGITGGLAPAMGGTSSSQGTTVGQQYQAAPSLGSQVMGGLTTLGGLAAPTLMNAIMPGLGSAIGAGMGAMGMNFLPRGFADGGGVDDEAMHQIDDRNSFNPDFTLNPYPEMRADGGHVGSSITDPLIREKMFGMLPYGGATSSISPELIAMNRPRNFEAPRLMEMHEPEFKKVEQRPTAIQGFTSGLKAALSPKTEQERKPAAYGGFQGGYGMTPRFGGYGKGAGFSPFAANRAMTMSGGDNLVPNPAGGPDVPASQLAFMQGQQPQSTTANPQATQSQPQQHMGFSPQIGMLLQALFGGGGYGFGGGGGSFGGYGKGGGFNPQYANGGSVRPGYADGFTVEDYLPALAAGESGGHDDPYRVIGPKTKYGRPLGKYQITEANVPAWSEEAGLGRLTPEEFLASDKAQEAIARHKFGQYMRQSGLEGTPAAAEAAKMWFAGPGYKKHLGAKDVLGTSIPQYEAKFLKNLGAPSKMASAGFGDHIVATDRGDEDNVVATDQKPQSAGFQITPEMQMGIISAGLGMLANRSPFMGVGVGEGGLKGVETYMQAVQQRRANEQLAAQMENIKSEIAQRTAETGLKQRQMDLLTEADQAAKNLIYGTPPTPKRTAAADTEGAPVLASDEGATGEQGGPTQLPGGDLAEGQEPKPTVVATDRKDVETADIDPLWDPRQLAKLAQVWSVANPNLAKLYQERVDRIQETGMTYNRAGQPIPLPGYLERKASVAATEETAREAAKSPYTMVEIQPEPGGPVYKVPQSELMKWKQQGATEVNPGAGSPPGGELKLPKGAVVTKQPEFVQERQKEMAKGEMAMLEQFKGRQIARERLDIMADILSRYQPGKWAEQKASIINGLRSIGFPVSDENMRSAADFEEFTKNATQSMFAQVKDLGGKILVSEIEGMKQANPAASLTPEANRKIIGQMRGLLDYEDKHYDDYSNWREGNPNAYDANKFERDWVKANKPKTFIEESTKNIPTKGEVLPPKDQLTVGYKIVRGNDTYEWDGSRFKKVAK